jgi:glucose 1-dehydrogenase
MKALVAYPPKNRSVEFREVPAPEPGPGEVLLATQVLGIDGTDREIHEGIYGIPPPGSDYLIIGHEAVVEVMQVGAGVTSFSVGDVVVPTVRRPCPENCRNCRGGETDRCITGHYREHGIQLLHGFAAEYSVTDADYLVRVPPEIRDVAVLLEPLSVAESAVAEIYRIQQRMVWEPSHALVIGAGPLGLLATMLLRLRGIAVSTAATRGDDSKKAEIVRQFGARYLNSRTTPLASFPEHFDIILDATGSADAVLDSLPLLERNGVMCLLGIYRKEQSCGDMGALLTRMVLSNQLLFGSVNARRSHFETGIGDMVYAKERFGDVLSQLITREFPPEEFLRVFEDDPEDIKTVIRFRKA